MPHRKQTKLWKTKDGNILRICDMEDSHLLNAIRLLQRRAEARRIRNSVFYATCTGPTAEGAMMAFDQECDQAWSATLEDYLPSIYDNLTDEAERRKLEIPVLSERLDIEVQLLMSRIQKGGSNA